MTAAPAAAQVGPRAQLVKDNYDRTKTLSLVGVLSGRFSFARRRRGVATGHRRLPPAGRRTEPGEPPRAGRGSSRGGSAGDGLQRMLGCTARPMARPGRAKSFDEKWLKRHQ